MEEAIHLPSALDPDMARVLSRGGEDENLGAGAREWVGGKRERMGERGESLSPYKGSKYQAPPHSP